MSAQATAREPAARAEELRRSIAGVGEPVVRATLRVELAELLRVHGDPPGALAELTTAAGEAPAAAAVQLSMLAASAALPPSERASALDRALAAAARPVSAWLMAAGEAHQAAGHPAAAVARFVECARAAGARAGRLDASRRAAQAAAAAGLAQERLVALRLAAELASGADRRVLLEEALSVAESLGDGPLVLALLELWLAVGGKPQQAVRTARRAVGFGAPREAVEKFVATLEPPAAERAPAAVRAAAAPRRADPLALLQRALRAARALEPTRALRWAEQAVRAGADSPALLAEIHAALRKTGGVEQSLCLRRTELESVPEAERTRALEQLAAEAEQEGASGLVDQIRHDVHPHRPVRAVRPAADPRTPAQAFVAAQRVVAAMTEGADPGPALALLARCLVGHRAADDALSLAVRLAREAGRSPVPLLRQAFLGESVLGRRVQLAERIVTALEEAGDLETATDFLDEALDLPPVKETVPLRRRRAALLKKRGLDEQLAVALGADAEAVSGSERQAVLAERAQLLDKLGKHDPALRVRVEALQDAPADVELLRAARVRLEARGDRKMLLRLLTAAVASPDADEAVRPKLLADLAEVAASVEGKETEALQAWLAVLEAAPGHERAGDEAERLLRMAGRWDRAVQLLACRAAREADPARRAPLLWRLAELRRQHLGQADEAFRLYRELAPATTILPARLPRGMAPGEEDGAALAMLHAARALVAPTPQEKAAALLDRAEVALRSGGAVDAAAADLRQAFELDPGNVGIVLSLERVHQSRGGWDELEAMLAARRGELPARSAARSWFGSGRVAEHTGDPVHAALCYRKAIELDAGFREPVTALRALAMARSDFPEAVRLLQTERALETRPELRLGILVELGNLLADRMREPARALEVLEEAAAIQPENEPVLRSLTALYLQQKQWDRAAAALEKRLALGLQVPDAADIYYRLGRAAEDAGELDRALLFYSRSYGRNSNHRPTLERLSSICFAQGQWENAAKATSALVDRHGEAMEPAQVLELSVRIALAELHVGQRATAIGLIARMASARAGMEVGVRDVADAWAATRLEPRLLRGLDAKRRQRIAARLTQALAAVERLPPGERNAAAANLWKISAALAFVDERWDEALALLERLGHEPSLSPSDRCSFHLAAGDIAARQGDPAAAQRAYRNARILRPDDPRLAARQLAAGIDVSHLELLPSDPDLDDDLDDGPTRS